MINKIKANGGRRVRERTLLSEANMDKIFREMKMKKFDNSLRSPLFCFICKLRAAERSRTRNISLLFILSYSLDMMSGRWTSLSQVLNER